MCKATKEGTQEECLSMTIANNTEKQLIVSEADVDGVHVITISLV